MKTPLTFLLTCSLLLTAHSAMAEITGKPSAPGTTTTTPTPAPSFVAPTGGPAPTTPNATPKKADTPPPPPPAATKPAAPSTNSPAPATPAAPTAPAPLAPVAPLVPVSPAGDTKKGSLPLNLKSLKPEASEENKVNNENWWDDNAIPPSVKEELKRFKKERRAQYERLSPEAKQVLRIQRDTRKKNYYEAKKAEEAAIAARKAQEQKLGKR